ncbi:MAG: agmatinase family protein [Brumimicrobium sp.]|nr:agmatinase family protein [Brumimicrobium sp.]
MSEKKKFDPHGVGVANGNIFGFPVTETEADIVILPVCWDVTASYGKGTSRGPEQILEASTQLDFYHPKLPKAYETKVFMAPVAEDVLKLNDQFVLETQKYIDFLESGGKLDESEKFQMTVQAVNDAQKELKEALKVRTIGLLRNGKIPAVLGGEHSVPLGLIEALAENYKSFGILQIDAHADLRIAYEGFEQSHASIFYNALQNKSVEKLVQVGIRDVSAPEVEMVKNSNGRIRCFYDWEIKEDQFRGKTWKDLVAQIISELPQRVYISFDIDALEPSLCPNTGTPVPGGFKLEETNYLIHELVSAGKEIIGFDLCEVANGNDDWDANVGARCLWNLVVAVERSRRL